MRAYGIVVGSRKREKMGAKQPKEKGAVSWIKKPLDGADGIGFYVRERASELGFYGLTNCTELPN